LLIARLIVVLLVFFCGFQQVAAEDVDVGVVSSMTPAFSKAQAKAGKKLYKQTCLSCHPKGYFDQVFRAWQGEPVGELFSIMRTDMPQNDPGGLSVKEYAQVFAYILDETGYPSGPDVLLPDDVTFRQWRIQALQ
jgi:mono/diheme cytochrome c family protein